MSENNSQATCLYRGVPAMQAVNRVAGFDPMNLLRPAVSRTTGKNVWKLDLRYMRAWFRMARPNGRVHFKPLRITEQLAIFEAQVFMDRSDAEPISNFTAQCTREEAEDGDYIRAAQDAALEAALNDAGFGIQFADLTYDGTGERYGSEMPAGTAGATRLGTEAQPDVPAGKTATAENERASEDSLPATPAMQPVAVQQTVTANGTAGEQPKTPRPAPTMQPVAVKLVQTQQTVAANGTAGEQPKTPKPAPAMQPVMMKPVMMKPVPPVQTTGKPVTAAESQVQAQEAAPKYTRDMAVEEIEKLMTLEEARKVVVETGACKGWTMAEVAERRAPSLKFYMYVDKKPENNIVRAAAKIMLESMEGRKAG